MVQHAGNLQDDFLMNSQQDTNVLHVGELDCIRHRWAIIGELYFAGTTVEQPMITHAEGATIQLST